MSKIRSKNYRDTKKRREKQATTHDESDESEVINDVPDDYFEGNQL